MAEIKKLSKLQPEFREIVEKLDFIIYELQEEFSKKKNPFMAFLYGSVEQGNATDKSDIDIYILFLEKRPSTNQLKYIGDKLNKVVTSSGKKLHIEYDFPPKLNKSLARSAATGMWLGSGSPFQSLKELKDITFDLGLVEYDLFVCDFTKITKSKAVTISKKLNGFEQKKIVSGKIKTYVNKGIVETIGGKKISKGVFLIPKKSSQLIAKLFEEYGVVPKVTIVFLIE